MLEIDAAAIKKIIEMILDLKAKQEVAEKKLESLGIDPASLQPEHKNRLAELRKGLARAGWMNSHPEKVQGSDLEGLLKALESRR